MSPFQLVFEPSKCPSASTETSVRSKKTSVRSKKKKKQKNSKTKVRRRTKRRRQQQRGGKFQRASLTFFSYTRINCRYGLAILISQSNNNHSKNTTVVHFSAFVDLATEVSAILPLWRLKLSVYFHLGEYFWKDFSSPAVVGKRCLSVLQTSVDFVCKNSCKNSFLLVYSDCFLSNHTVGCCNISFSCLSPIRREIFLLSKQCL